MPRDSSGNYTAPGNPQASGTTITAAFINTLMDDLQTAISDSLDRNGRGGMLSPFENADGTEAGPGITFANEVSSGFYREGQYDVRFALNGTKLLRMFDGKLAQWDSSASDWKDVLTDIGTQVGQYLRYNGTEWETSQNIFEVVDGVVWVGNNADSGIRFDAVFSTVAMTGSAPGDSFGDPATKAITLSGLGLNLGGTTQNVNILGANGEDVVFTPQGKILVGGASSGSTMLRIKNPVGTLGSVQVFDSSDSEQLALLDNGHIRMPQIYGQTSAQPANVYMDPNGRLFRSTA